MTGSQGASAQQALLGLERSTLPAEEQLDEAFKILEIRYEELLEAVQDSSSHLNVKEKSSFAPKEEWVLRWLLKRIRSSSGKKDTKYSLLDKTWLLLHHVLLKVPSKALGKLLKEADFLTLLEAALTEIATAHNTDERFMERSRDVTTSEQSFSPPSEGSLKRKRVSGNALTPSKRPKHDTTGVSDLLILVKPILRTLEACVLKEPGSRTDSPLHVRLALRGQPRPVASLLGKIMRLSDVILLGLKARQSEHNEANGTKDTKISASSTELDDVLVALGSILNLWSFRSVQNDGKSDSEDTNAFMQHMLTPALSLLSTIGRRRSSVKNAYPVKSQLEQMIALNVAQPLRLIARKTSTEPKDGDSQNTATIQSILKFLQPAITKAGTSEVQEKALAVFSALSPTLYELMIRSVPRNNIRKQQQENQWLQDLLFALTALAGCPIIPVEISGQQLEPVPKTLDRLLELAARWTIRVDEDALTKIASTYTGLEKSSGMCRWPLVACIIVLDPMVFVTSATESQSLSDLLFIQLSNLDHDAIKDDNTILQEIVTPLFAAYGRARLLPSLTTIWRQYLSATLEHQLSDDQPDFTIWTDEHLLEAFIQVASANLTSPAIEGELKVAVEHMEEHEQVYGISCAEIVISDAILMSNPQQCSSSTSLPKLMSLVQAAVSSKSAKVPLRWHGFRFLHHAYAALKATNNIERTSLPSNETLKLARSSATGGFRVKTKASENSGGHNLLAYEAFQFCIVFESVYGDGDFFMPTCLAALTTTISEINVKTEGMNPWDGRTSTLSSKAQLAQAFLAVVLQHPWVLLHRSENSDEIVEALIHLVGELASIPEAYPGVFAEALKVMATDDRFSKRSGWSMRVGNLIHDELKKINKLPPTLSDMLLYIPLEAVPRRKMSELVDFILDLLEKQEADLDPGQYKKYMCIILRLVESADAHNKIMSDSSGLWSFAALPFAKSNGNLLEKLCTTVLLRKLASIDLKRSADYVDSLFRACSASLEAKASYNSASGHLHLCRRVIIDMTEAEDKMRGSQSIGMWSFYEDFLKLRNAFSKYLLKRVHAIAKSSKKNNQIAESVELEFILDTLSTIASPAFGTTDSDRDLTQLDSHYREAGPQHAESRLKIEATRLRLYYSATEDGTIEQTLQNTIDRFGDWIANNPIHMQQPSGFATTASLLVRGMPSRMMVLLLDKVQQVKLDSSEGIARILLTAAIISLPMVADIDGFETALITTLHSLLTGMPQCTDESVFIVTCDTICMILQNRPEAVNQYNFDNLIASIATVTSPSGPRILAPSARSLIIPRLSRILSILLSRHRKKLGGRYHLLVPALQGLLTSIFVPPQSRTNPPSKSDFWHSRLPPWASSSSQPLTPAQITPFTRLLRVITDPSPSTVTTHRSNSSLTDETALARRVAGTYTQYLISTYCHILILGGVLTPDVREALRPGIWSILDAMTIEGMRVMNAQMIGVGERSVWKEVYGEWKRVGKWKGD